MLSRPLTSHANYSFEVIAFLQCEVDADRPDSAKLLIAMCLKIFWYTMKHSFYRPSTKSRRSCRKPEQSFKCVRGESEKCFGVPKNKRIVCSVFNLNFQIICSPERCHQMGGKMYLLGVEIYKIAWKIFCIQELSKNKALWKDYSCNNLI